MATKKKSTISLPPEGLNTPAMVDVISRGGTVGASEGRLVEEKGADVLKSFTFKIYEGELAQIRALVDMKPKRDRQSLHDFIVAAVKEKIAREERKLKK